VGPLFRILSVILLLVVSFVLSAYSQNIDPQAAATPAATTIPTRDKPPYAPGTTDPLAKAPTECYPSATHPYVTQSCYILVDRKRPGSPLPRTVPRGTSVLIKVQQRPNTETIQFVQATDAVPPPDFGLALVKLFLPGISAITVRSEGRGFLFDVDVTPPSIEEEEQVSIAKNLLDLQRVFDGMTVEIDLLKEGEYAKVSAASEALSNKPDQCTGQPPYDGPTFSCAKNVIIGDTASTEQFVFPTGQLKALDGAIAARIAACYDHQKADAEIAAAKTDDDKKQAVARAVERRKNCLARGSVLEKSQVDLNAALTKLQAKQVALVAVGKALATLPATGDYIDQVASSPNHKATIKITAKDVLSGTSTDVATVVITWQGSNFSLSTGILLSTLPNRVYANSPIIVNGVPSTDGSGKVLTIVTENDTRPSVVTPLALLNYEVTRSNYCKGRCGVSISGGLGANLTTKSADYAAGVSWRYRDLLFTPAFHYGRETVLSNGVNVGQKLGSSPPALPTQMLFRPNFGFAVTYRIPIP
jgi:hypothetical protein